MLAHEGVSERGIHGPLALSLRTGRCRMSGLVPDVRGFVTGRMSGLGGQMSGLAWVPCGCSLDRRGPDVRAGGRMSGGSGRAGCPGLWLDVRAGGAGFCGSWHEAAAFRGFGRISGLRPDVRALETWQTWLLLMEKFQGPAVWGLGRMSGAWKVILSVSAGSLHPRSGQLVRLHVHPWEVHLDT